jgi:hypothetical protein
MEVYVNVSHLRDHPSIPALNLPMKPFFTLVPADLDEPRDVGRSHWKDQES